MKLLTSFIITCISTAIMSALTMLLLYFTSNYLDHWSILFGQLFILLSIPVIFLVLYLPIFNYNKISFSKKDPIELYKKYLWISLLPIVTLSIFLIETIMQSYELKIVLLNALLTTLFEFYLFVKTATNKNYFPDSNQVNQ